MLNNGARRGFTIVEVLVVIGILMLLLGFLLGTVHRVRSQAQAVACRAQLHQIGVAISAYSAASSGLIAPTDGDITSVDYRWWPKHLFGSRRPNVVVCPIGRGQEVLSYALNAWLEVNRTRFGKAKHVPSSTVVLAGENWTGANLPYNFGTAPGQFPSYDPAKHGPRLLSNFLWFDFHVSNERPNFYPDAPDDWYVWLR